MILWKLFTLTPFTSVEVGVKGIVKNVYPHPSLGRGKKNRLFLGKSPKLWVGGGQES